MAQDSRRTERANERLAALAAKYVSEGLEPQAAKDKALSEMRDNGRGDWRDG